MQQNKIYDVIIIGASKHGLALAEMLEDNGQVALISNSFVHRSKKQLLASTDLIEGKAVLLTYIHGLLGVTLNNNTTIFGNRVVFSTGTQPLRLALKNSNIKYNLCGLLAKNKSAQAVVYGEDDLAVQYAIELSKFYRYVYLCSKSLELACTKRLAKQLNTTANIVHLPGCSIVSCKNDTKGNLIEITLDTYSTINTSTVVISIGRTPDLPPFANKYIKSDDKGYAITKEFYESTLVPKVYAIGDLLPKPTKKGLTTLAQKLKEEISNAGC